MKKQWQIQTPDRSIVRELCDSIKCHPVLAAVLVNRNITTSADARAFLSGSLKQLRAPFDVRGMSAAVRRIHTALMQKEKILVFGDYDVDGVTSTALLYEFLRALNADVHYYVPHRVTEGYGLRVAHVHDYIEPNHFKLVITVDCGSSSHEAVAAANAAGINVIITDHHQIAVPLPDAVAIVNPKRSDCSNDFEPLAGVGVVYLVLICLRKHLREAGFWSKTPEPNLKRCCDLVALGTIADIVPLIRENRILTQTGLDVINAALRPGIQALLKEAAVRGPQATGEDIAFRLAPRLNAAGRIAHAQLAIDLLTTRDPARAEEIARRLNELNNKRRLIEQKILMQAQQMALTTPEFNRKPAIVLCAEDWHEGVLGIVASKLAERFFRPVVLISTRNGIGKGSARSIPGFNLYQGILNVSEHLERFGGHAGAAGLTVKKEKISAFAAAFENEVKHNTPKEAFLPLLCIDQELSFDQISATLTDELHRLQPFGEGNPEPLFMAKDIAVSNAQTIGGAHRRMSLRQPSAQTDQRFQAIHFNVQNPQVTPSKFERIAFRLRWNHWRGQQSIQLLIEATEDIH